MRAAVLFPWVLVWVLTGCKTEAQPSVADAAPVSSTAAKEKELADLETALAAASAATKQAHAEIADSYVEAKKQSKISSDTLDARATAAKEKAKALPAAKKAAFDALSKTYDARRADVQAAIAKLPDHQPDAKVADSSVAAMVPLLTKQKEATEALEHAAGQ